MQQLATSLQAATAFARRITWMAGSSQSQKPVGEPGLLLPPNTLQLHFAVKIWAGWGRWGSGDRRGKSGRKPPRGPSHWSPPKLAGAPAGKAYKTTIRKKNYTSCAVGCLFYFLPMAEFLCRQQQNVTQICQFRICTKYTRHSFRCTCKKINAIQRPCCNI